MRSGAEAGTIIFTTLAMNQTRFYAALGEALDARGFRVFYICFHEPSLDYLRQRGHRAFNAFDGPAAPSDPDLARYGIENLNLLLNHEKAAFGLRDSTLLRRKFGRYLSAVDAALDELAADAGPAVMVQEAGGFLSLLSAFYAARARGLDNIFIEPSFFRGRVFFTCNSLRAPTVLDPQSIAVSGEVADYLESTLAGQRIVIPQKDKHHYRAAAQKLADPHNIRRLAEKLVDKYVLGKSEEFNHIGSHVTRHLRMFLTSLRLKSHYQGLPPGGSFVYYPLHVPADFALTIRSPEYLDQCALLDFVASCLPDGVKLAVKEHPALQGAIAFGRIRDLLRRHDNLVLLDPSLNNFQVMQKAAVVLTVNSKSGAEALLLGKPVVTLGDGFYTRSRLVHHVDRIADFSAALVAALRAASPANDPEEIRQYFQQVWNCCWPGELYHLAPDNISVFSDSLATYLKRPDLEQHDRACYG